MFIMQWVMTVTSHPDMLPADWQDAFNTLLDNAMIMAAE